MIEGPRTVGEVFDAGHEPSIVIVPEYAEDDPSVVAIEDRLSSRTEFLLVRDHVFERLAPSATPQPMLAIVARPVAALPAESAVVLVLAGVGDPGNLGTLVRAADAVAADAVVVVGGADPWGPKAVRASAGSMLRVPIVQYDDLGDAVDALREGGVRVVGTDVTGGEPFDQGVLDRPVAIVMGSEPHGLDRDVDLDAWTHIAMPGRTESLNVAMAGTLLLYEAARG
ncbi:MAG: RNA methyltransferase [Actinomycetota bacterium]